MYLITPLTVKIWQRSLCELLHEQTGKNAIAVANEHVQKGSASCTASRNHQIFISNRNK